MILFPNAKINLGLDITARRPDGYHEIETVMVPIGWSDILEIVPGHHDYTTLTLSGRAVNCPVEKNLVMKAVRAVEKAVGTTLPPVDIYLRKIVPDGAGLGGGSADAAFTVKGLNQVLALGFTEDEMAKIASTIGADCPFFIYNRPMIATGIGTTLSPVSLDLSGLTIAVVKPPQSVPTAEAYRGVTPHRPATPLLQRIAAPVSQWQGAVTNDFEVTVGAAIPAIDDIKRKLIDLGAVYTAMSGSGSAVFGIFTADILADDIAARFPACDTFLAPLA